MLITKAMLLKSIQELPEKFSIDELLERLLLLQKIELGLEQSAAGQGISIEESKKQLERWLK